MVNNFVVELSNCDEENIINFIETNASVLKNDKRLLNVTIHVICALHMDEINYFIKWYSDHIMTTFFNKFDVSLRVNGENGVYPTDKYEKRLFYFDDFKDYYKDVVNFLVFKQEQKNRNKLNELRLVLPNDVIDNVIYWFL